MTSLLQAYWPTMLLFYAVPVVILLETAAQPRSHGGEYCDTEVFRAECADGELIMVERARYGRMKLGRCVEIDLGYLGCQRDVMAIADRRCSGKRVCEIRIPDAEFEGTRACLKELKTYLEVAYRCVTPEAINPETCRWQDSYNVSASSSPQHNSGYLSSGAVTAPDVPVACNRPDRPWTITVRPGQRINLTLINFTPLRMTHPSTTFMSVSVSSSGDNAAAIIATDDDDTQVRLADGGNVSPSSSTYRCQQPYGRIEDSGSPYRAPLRICGTERRFEPLMVSRGNTVRVWLDPSGGGGGGHHRANAGYGSAASSHYETPEPNRFLIHFTVIGCPNPEQVAEMTWFQRRNDTVALAGCDHSDATWFLYCQQGIWVGSIGNCTKPVETTTTVSTSTSLATTMQLKSTAPALIGGSMLSTSGRVQSVRYVEHKVDPYPISRVENHDESDRNKVLAISLLTAFVVIICFIVLLIVLVKHRSWRGKRVNFRRRSVINSTARCCNGCTFTTNGRRSSAGGRRHCTAGDGDANGADVKLCETTTSATRTTPIAVTPAAAAATPTGQPTVAEKPLPTDRQKRQLALLQQQKQQLEQRVQAIRSTGDPLEEQQTSALIIRQQQQQQQRRLVSVDGHGYEHVWQQSRHHTQLPFHPQHQPQLPYQLVRRTDIDI